MSSEHRRFKAVLFDLGGTLVKTGSVPEILKRILETYGVQKSMSEIESAQREVENRLTLEDYTLPSNKFWDKWNTGILKWLGIQENTQFLVQAMGDRWWDFVDLELYPDVMETLNYLKERGFKTGLVTNGFKSDIDEILPRVGLTAYFDAAVGVDAVGKPKPHKEIFIFALERLDVRPCETIFVGDSLEADYEGAETAGLTAILIEREDKMKNDVRKVRSLTELKKYLR